MLIKEEVFSYARLSACYLYGFDRLRKERSDVGKMPRPENLIYQKFSMQCGTTMRRTALRI